MKCKNSVARDPLARDIYERAMQPYWGLQAEANRERLLNQIPVTGQPRRRWFRFLLAVFGSGLIALGVRLQKAGQKNHA